MPYEFDVFISYRRQPLTAEWLNDHFVPLFRGHLEEAIAAECGRELQDVFWDQTGIEPGNEWPTTLREAIRESRCLVAMWSPLYFLSRWCLTEWRSFAARGQQAARNLVLPVSVHDGKAFPAEAQRVQIADFSEYLIVGPGFRQTRKHVEFQTHLKRFAGTVAKAIRTAPEFAEWPIEEPKILGEISVTQSRL